MNGVAGGSRTHTVSLTTRNAAGYTTATSGAAPGIAAGSPVYRTGPGACARQNGVPAEDRTRDSTFAGSYDDLLHHGNEIWRLAAELHRPLLCFRQTLSSESFRAVLPHGNAPWSAGYQPAALLLSYGREMAESAGNAPASGGCRTSFSGRAPPAWIGLDSVAPSRGFAPRPLALTGRWTTVIPRWNCETGLPGRSFTCTLRVRNPAFYMLNYGEMYG